VSNYRVEKIDNGSECEHCNRGTYWTVVSGHGDDETEIGQSFADKELTEDICDHMNYAFDAGRESLLLVLGLASELCSAVDAAEEDIGGCRPVNDILAELGPAVDAAERQS
jgi:hypothetical protein